MIQFLEVLGNITVSTIVLWVMAFGFIVGGAWKITPIITNWYDKQKTNKEILDHYKEDIKQIYQDIKENNDAMNSTVTEIKDSVNNICQAQIETLNDSIRQKCRYYISLKYIPEDELEDFKRMMETYESIGGNHGLEVKFNKTMELPVQIKEDEK